jgi:hypothetical protein
LAQLLKESIISVVGDLGAIFNVVEVIVAADLCSKRVYALFGRVEWVV